MIRRRSNPDFLNGIPELVILQLLSQKPMYGYQLVQALKEATGQTLAFGEGCIYPLLHRLEEEGSLTSRRQMVGGRSRIVYRISTRGKGRLHSAVERWHEIVQAVNTILQGGQCEKATLSHQFTG